jgi:hypothetical protein
MKIDVFRWYPTDDGDYVIYGNRQKKFLWFTLPSNYTTVWKGSCTVWENFETGERASTSVETELCRIWNLICWGRLDHLKRISP